MTVTLYQRPAFKRVYKKLHANQRDAVHAAMRQLIANPRLGEEKKGDLAGVWVYRFDCVNQLYLLAYLQAPLLLAQGAAPSHRRVSARRSPTANSSKSRPEPRAGAARRIR